MVKTDRLWMNDWDRARQHYADWWQRKGLLFHVTAPADRPHAPVEKPPAPADLEEYWFGVDWRIRSQECRLSRTYFGGDAIPAASAMAGAGDLGAYLGSPVDLAPDTVWYKTCIQDPPERHPPLRLNLENAVYRKQVELARRLVEASQGRYLVVMPDLVENLDILAALRGTQALMTDLVDRPAWVADRLEEINQAFFQAYDVFHRMTADDRGGSSFCFDIWGTGRTCKVQCDASALISPAMFRALVVPPLQRQCAWLDNSLYHLDGEDCIQHVDALLEIPELDAIEWTPRWLSQGRSGGSRKFHDLYRRILRGGKCVQAIGVKQDEVIPLLDAVGPKGLYISASAPTAEAARMLEEKVERYR